MMRRLIWVERGHGDSWWPETPFAVNHGKRRVGGYEAVVTFFNYCLAPPQ